MADAVLMPKLSSTMTHGSVNKWFVNEGDFVKVGDPLFEVETDKIAIEVESYNEGYILKKYIDIDEEVPCNSTIAYIGEKGEEVPETMKFDVKTETTDTVEEVELIEKSESHSVENAMGTRATPYARKLAKENNLALESIIGNGNKGRIQAQDVLKVISTTNISEVKDKEDIEFIPWKGMRKAIADNMVESMTTIPHVSMVATANIQNLKELKDKLKNNSNRNITFTDIISYLTVQALKRYPYLNARTSDEGISIFKNINLGIAVSLDEGLIVPVIKEANLLSVEEISSYVESLSVKAREANLSTDEIKGGTFTISSIGRSRVKNFTSIINYPEVGILGIGGIYELGNDSFIDLTLSFDHRAVDGAPASKFLDYLISIVEDPILSIL